jgi:hypothetical protein
MMAAKKFKAQAHEVTEGFCCHLDLENYTRGQCYKLFITVTYVRSGALNGSMHAVHISTAVDDVNGLQHTSHIEKVLMV